MNARILAIIIFFILLGIIAYILFTKNESGRKKAGSIIAVFSVMAMLLTIIFPEKTAEYIDPNVEQYKEDNQELKKQIAELEKQIENIDQNSMAENSSDVSRKEVIGLQDLKKIDSIWYEEIEPFEDSYGNQYETGYQFTASEDGYAVYSLQGKYTTFSAKIVCSSETGSGADMSITVYVDDTYVETIPNITKEIETKQIGPYNITGARKLSIKTTNEGEYSNGNCFLVDAFVE